MKYLYVNNFRGFLKTFIPIFDVNFLVGENSTGKTSILKLLKLLSLPEFWFKLDFSLEDVEFTQFSDIVSNFSEEKRCFDIGLIKSNNTLIDDNLVAFLMTFIEIDGMPFLSALTFTKGHDIFRIRFSKTYIKYKKITIDQKLSLEFLLNQLFNNWVLEHKTDTRGYKLIKSPEKLSIEELPLIIITELVENISGKKNAKGDKKRKKEIKLSSFDSFFPLAFDREIAWIAPIRTKPKRTYDIYKSEFSSEGNHTPYLIKRILDKDREAKKFKNFIKSIGSSSGLFEDIKIKKYGKGATAPFELDIILNEKPFSICSVGYGVSQSLPVIVELFTRTENTWYAIQQPEVHLHPKAQAALGDLFFQFAKLENKKFLIETHSDYLIDRFRINMRNRKTNNLIKAQILFFERDNIGNKIYQLPIGSDGSLPQDQPVGYRDFFIKEQMLLLGID